MRLKQSSRLIAFARRRLKSLWRASSPRAVSAMALPPQLLEGICCKFEIFEGHILDLQLRLLNLLRTDARHRYADELLHVSDLLDEAEACRIARLRVVLGPDADHAIGALEARYMWAPELVALSMEAAEAQFQNTKDQRLRSAGLR